MSDNKLIEELTETTMRLSLENLEKGITAMHRGTLERDKVIRELRTEIMRLRKMLEEKTAQIRGLRGEDI